MCVLLDELMELLICYNCLNLYGSVFNHIMYLRICSFLREDSTEIFVRTKWVKSIILIRFRSKFISITYSPSILVSKIIFQIHFHLQTHKFILVFGHTNIYFSFILHLKYMDVCYDFGLYVSSHPKYLILGDPSQDVTTRSSFRNICKPL